MVSKVAAQFSESTFSFRMNPKGGSGSNVQMRNQATITEQLFSQEIGTSTRVETAEVGTKTVHAGTDPQEEDEYYSDDEGVHRPPPEFNMDALANFLEKVEPLFNLHLTANQEQRAFDNYEVIWEEEFGEINELHVVKTDFDFIQANQAVQKTLNLERGGDTDTNASTRGGPATSGFDEWDDKPSQSAASQSRAADSVSEVSRQTGGVSGLDSNYQVTSVAWNCNGSSLAVAYGKTNHVSWCEHQSVVSIFSPFRRAFDPKKATLNIEVPNCVTEVAWHPTEPVMLAGGTMNGQIILWNIDEQNPVLQMSEIDEYYHREAITSLIWVRQESLVSLAITTSLVSTSTDGKILVWRMTDKLRFPIKGHLLSKKKGAETAIIGGTSLDKVYIAEDNTYFCGTEGGQVFKCSIAQPTDNDISHFFEANTGVRWKQEAINLLANLPSKVIMEVKKRVERYVQDKGERDVYAPTVYQAKPNIKLLFPTAMNASYEKHMGPCLGISCSPFVKRLFLSCSSDGSVRLYDTLNQRPIIVFEPGYNEYIMKVAWSPFRPCVFIAVSNTGSVYIYDLVLSQQTPSYILEYKAPPGTAGGAQSKTAYSIAFNPIIRDFLAIGYHDGSSKIFQLNYSLSRKKKDEDKTLKSLMEEKDQF